MTLFRIRLLPAALFGSAAAVLACSTMAEFPSDGPAVDSLEPSRVQVTAVLGTAVISWSAVPDAISYNLYVSTDAALTQASGSAPGVFRYSGVASPRSVSGLDPTRVWFMLVVFLISATTALACNLYLFSRAAGSLKESLHVILEQEPRIGTGGAK